MHPARSLQVALALLVGLAATAAGASLPIPQDQISAETGANAAASAGSAPAAPGAAPEVSASTEVDAELTTRASLPRGGGSGEERAGRREWLSNPIPGLEVPLVAPPVSVLAFGGLGASLAAALGLYHRIEGRRVLENPRRREISALVEREPGISRTEIQRRLGLAWGVLLHHLGRLEDSRILASEVTDGRRRYYATGRTAPGARRAVGLLRDPALARAVEFVELRPGASLGEASAALGLTPSAASKAFTRLERAGLVERRRAARHVLLFPGPRAPERPPERLAKDAVPIPAG